MKSSWLKRALVALGILAVPLAAWAGTAATSGRCCPWCP